MAWTEPATFVAGQIVTAADFNLITDNFATLKGSSGTVAIDAGITASGVVLGTGGLNTPGKVSGLALTIADAITAAGLKTAGRISGNTARIAGVTQAAGVVASDVVSGATHMTVSGIVTAQAGMAFASHLSALGSLTASGIINARLGMVAPTHISAAGNVSVQSGMTVAGADVSWHGSASESGAHGLICTSGGAMLSVNCGTYTGNGSGMQSIQHGLGAEPVFIRIQSRGSGYHVGIYNAPILVITRADRFWPIPSSYANASVFKVGVTGEDDGTNLNASGVQYLWAGMAQ